jgi:Contractile injection system tape measure protein
MNHVIAKTVFNVTADNSLDGLALQQDLSRVFWQSLTEVIDKVFDDLKLTDKTLVIDTLELDLGQIDPKNWQTTVVEKLKEALQTALARLVVSAHNLPNAKDQTADATTVLQSHRLFDIWIHFLKTGTLPPSVSATLDEAIWRKAIVETLTLSAYAEQQLLERLKAPPSVFQANTTQNTALARLILQYDEPFLAQIAAILTRSDMAQLPALRGQFFNYLKTSATRQTNAFFKKGFKMLELNYAKQAFWTALFQAITHNTLYKTSAETAVLIPLKLFFEKESLLKNAPQAQEFVAVLNSFSIKRATEATPSVSKGFLPLTESNWVKLETEIAKILETRFAQAAIKSNSVELDIKKPSLISNKEMQGKEKGVKNTEQYIQNGGVVLTHAFLPLIFKELKWLNDKKQFKNESVRHRAIHLIHYLATGQEGLPEYRLVLPKLLGGLRLDIPIERNIILKKKEKAEANALLNSVIKHWGVLGNTSIEALREGFFKRDGKLSQTEKGPLLQIEQRTEDILLSRLPWSISMIKLPWMPEMLFVEWA